MKNFSKLALALILVLTFASVMVGILFGVNENVQLAIAHTGMYLIEYALPVVFIAFLLSLVAGIYLLIKRNK